jgi:ABC-type multidrug transport system permease subunit
MNKELVSVSPWSAAKLTAAMMFGITAVIVIPMAILFAVVPPRGSPPWFLSIFLLVAPFIYAVFGALFGALGAAVYNLAARHLGGIQVVVVDKPGGDS